MGVKSYIEVVLKDAATLRDLPGLSQKVADACGFEASYQAGPNYTDFVLIDPSNQVSFYQGAAGEDEDDSYEFLLRIYNPGSEMARYFADHLETGAFVLTCTTEGNPTQVFAGTPGSFKKIN